MSSNGVDMLSGVRRSGDSVVCIVLWRCRLMVLTCCLVSDAKNAVELNAAKKSSLKPVHDPLIQDGKPLPSNGACKHYKKSFRWLRWWHSHVMRHQHGEMKINYKTIVDSCSDCVSTCLFVCLSVYVWKCLCL